MSAEDKLEKLLADVQNELKQKNAQITAARTQLSALQATHKDATAQVAETMAELVKAREAKAAARKEAEATIRDAEETAARIRGEADRRAAAVFKDAEETLVKIEAAVSQALATVQRKRIN